jgi:hypothetical protein
MVRGSEELGPGRGKARRRVLANLANTEMPQRPLSGATLLSRRAVTGAILWGLISSNSNAGAISVSTAFGQPARELLGGGSLRCASGAWEVPVSHPPSATCAPFLRFAAPRRSTIADVPAQPSVFEACGCGLQLRVDEQEEEKGWVGARDWKGSSLPGGSVAMIGTEQGSSANTALSFLSKALLGGDRASLINSDAVLPCA